MKILAIIALAAFQLGNQNKAEEVLRRADDIRAPSDSYQMVVAVDSHDGSSYSYQLNIGGKEESLIRTLTPKREVGKNFLMNGEQMWAYLPNIRRSVRVTLNQKLVGQAANGDISRMRWVGDYVPVIESESSTDWTLLLTANKSGLTYDKVRVWIDKATYRPIKGEYLSKSEKILKFVEFAEFSEIAGTIRPTRIIIRSATQSDRFSVLRVIDMKPKRFSKSYFRKANLK